MTWQFKTFFSYLGILCFSFLLLGAVQADYTIARVGKIPITYFDLQRKINRILPLRVSFHGGVSAERQQEIKKEALEELVTQALKAQYAVDQEIAVEPGALKAEMGIVVKRFKSREEFTEALGTEGLDAFRASLYRKLLAEAADKEVVGKGVKVPEEKVEEYYQENQDRFMRPRQFEASHILVKVDPSSNKEERAELAKKAEELAEKAKAGEDFYNLAYFNSDDRSKYVGGSLGLFHEGQTVPEFEQALKKMKPGEISAPVKTMYGYHIIKLSSVQEPKKLSYQEMAAKLRQQFEKEQEKELRAAWLEKLRETYTVDYLSQ